MSTETRKYELKARAESQRQTRERIVQATMELHEEVGPANTTVAEIARRAGVTRLTVYNHFPEDIQLFGACSAHWLERNPRPDLSDALAHNDPAERVEATLAAFYAWYRRTQGMIEKVQRDRGAIPALDSVVVGSLDAALDQLSQTLADGFSDRPRPAEPRLALIRLALDFWTWRRLDRQGLDDDAAAVLMAGAVASA